MIQKYQQAVPVVIIFLFPFLSFSQMDIRQDTLYFKNKGREVMVVHRNE